MLVFLIDADNLCMPGWVDEAIPRLEAEHGSISVKRAYGSADKLRGLTEVMRGRHIRPYVNLALSKNTTDVALAVDAMELSYLVPRPDVFVIGSGDADFVPLVLRLRERGFRVVCVSDPGKLAPEAVDAYDQVMLVGHAQPPHLPVLHPASKPAPVPAPATTKAKTPAKKTVPAKKAAAKKPAAKKAPAKKAKTNADSSAVDAGKVTVERILSVVPALKSGEVQSINAVAKLLHDEKLLGKNAPSSKLFKKFPHHFELIPSKQPNQVRYIPAP